ncbi:unnamed protein product [Meganyctiphanes norvegica]|uniref:Uncharacterized protein n=1 Tax=Meganyctiphanes norvegica TaxID=48144 RepID=A0AAV2RAH3_MEGNR
MGAAAQLILLVAAFTSTDASNYAHHFYSNQTGHIIPRAGNNPSGHSHRATAFICHGIQEITLSAGEEAIIESPGYPNRYPNRRKCGWDIRASDGSVIDISCPVFDLQKPNRVGVCKFDYLSIYGFRFCGKESVTATITNGELTKLRFRSNGGKSFPGFKCRADAITLSSTVASTGSIPTCVCGKANRVSRIVGGTETDENEYPWQAALVERQSSSVFCGGTLINDRYVLTAAHCTEGLRASNTQVLLGNHLQSKNDQAEIRVNIKSIIDHPYYNNQNLDRDFSLLELDETLDLSALAPKISPACLPETLPEDKYDAVAAVVSGWGTLSTGGRQPNALREVVVRTMTNDACNNNYDNGEIQPSMLCASNKGKDSCQGDSGGPLVTNDGGFFSVIGVVSWGYGCADQRYPGVYSRVTSELDWIKRNSHSSVTCSH